MSIRFKGGAHIRCDSCGFVFFKGRLMSLDELVLAAINEGKFTIDDNNPDKHNCAKCEKKPKPKEERRNDVG